MEMLNQQIKDMMHKAFYDLLEKKFQTHLTMNGLLDFTKKLEIDYVIF